ncbi:MAG: ABC transporter substrate-binding protein [Methanosarcinaceae archaeon]|nr:ABC transporter substrate-binding protein [Methanosarcinaceae archaeon]
MKKNTKKSIMAIILLIAAVFITGCVEDPVPPVEPPIPPVEDPVPPVEPPQLDTLRMSFQPSTHHAAFVVADEKGWWKRDLAPLGVNEIKVSPPFPSGMPQMLAMLAEEHDVAFVGAAPAISAIARGLDAKIVASVQTQGSDLVLRTDLIYETPADLKGLTIGTFPPGSIQHTVLSGWLIENDLIIGEDVTLVPMGPSPAKAAIAARTVDAVFLPHPHPTIIEEDGTGTIIVASGEMMAEHLCCVLVVSGTLIRDHPEIVEQIIRTFIYSTEYVEANIDESSEIFAERLGMDPEIVKRSFAEWDGMWVLDPAIVVPSALEIAQTQYDIEVIDEMLTKADLFDLTFYQKARN